MKKTGKDKARYFLFVYSFNTRGLSGQGNLLIENEFGNMPSMEFVKEKALTSAEKKTWGVELRDIVITNIIELSEKDANSLKEGWE